MTINVPCIYTSLRILNLVRYADLGLLVIATLLVIVGLIWCCVRHTKQLGHEDIAKFSFQSCLNPEFHSFPSPVYWPSCTTATPAPAPDTTATTDITLEFDAPAPAKSKSKRPWLFRHYPELNHLMRPRIENDINFLVLMLFRADTAHGQIFKSIQVSVYIVYRYKYCNSNCIYMIQISKHLKALIERDNQQLHLFSKVLPGIYNVVKNRMK